MQNNWLKGQLPPRKRSSELWADLADAVQEVLDTHVSGLLNRLEGLASLFSMSEEDLEVRLNEMGELFALGWVEPEDRALSVLQRTDEVRMKGTAYPIENTLRREFEGLNVTWERLYAPKDQDEYPYGTYLVREADLHNEPIPEDDWFLTSRGVIRVRLDEVFTVFHDDITGEGGTDDAIDAFEAQIARVIHPLIPLHIAFDGQQYYIHYTLIEADERAFLNEDGSVDTQWMKDTACKAQGDAEHLADTQDFGRAVGAPPEFPCVARAGVYKMDAWTLDKPIPIAKAS
ncbi:hypothetical protein [Thaumasiovibrio sp. DFM-14]|uniref:hypothetical protein n=1 Tax=Thaumasiovibrio sp. DFM-14 TaxID=3384792 RepID=UPI00399F1FFA